MKWVGKVGVRTLRHNQIFLLSEVTNLRQFSPTYVSPKITEPQRHYASFIFCSIYLAVFTLEV